MRKLLTVAALALFPGFVSACSSTPALPEQSSRPTSRPAQDAAAKFDHEHTQWTAILKKHVDGDRFDYAAIQKDPSALDAYIATLNAVTSQQLQSWTEDQRMAFWINVYNANTVKLVSGKYPLKSIRDLGTVLNKVWNKRFIDMPALNPSGKNKKLSLDDVEHKILRPRFEDARVHAAVNCASESCPPLRAEAFVAKRLDAQLDEQVRLWLADETRNQFDLAGGKMRVSEIFKWFKEDFVRDGQSVAGWIAEYAPDKVAEALKSGTKLKLGYLDYSWKLNDVKKK